MMQLSQHKRSNWPDVVLAAAAAHEPFQDVTIITAKSVFVDLAYEVAADLIYKSGNALTKEKVHAVARTIITERKLAVQEHVRISSIGITVCVDVPNVENEAVTWVALDRVAQALDSLEGCEGVVAFSADLQFTLEDVSSLLCD